MKYCDMCGENEPDYTYKDTIIGTDEEVINEVCSLCAEEIFQYSSGKDHQIFFHRIAKKMSPAVADLFAGG